MLEQPNFDENDQATVYVNYLVSNSGLKSEACKVDRQI